MHWYKDPDTAKVSITDYILGVPLQCPALDPHRHRLHPPAHDQLVPAGCVLGHARRRAHLLQGNRPRLCRQHGRLRVGPRLLGRDGQLPQSQRAPEQGMVESTILIRSDEVCFWRISGTSLRSFYRISLGCLFSFLPLPLLWFFFCFFLSIVDLGSRKGVFGVVICQWPIVFMQKVAFIDGWFCTCFLFSFLFCIFQGTPRRCECYSGFFKILGA